jgi:hypothetical protein
MRIRLYLALLLLPACASTYKPSVEVMRLSSNLAAKPSNCEVDVYMPEDKIDKAYDSLCVLTAQGENQGLIKQSTQDQILDRAIPYACECGADGIVITQINTWQNTGFFNNKVQTLTIKAIRYK